MAWEPRQGSKVAILLDAMEQAATSRPIWSQTEAAQAMQVPRANVPQYVSAACNAERMFRRTLANGGGIELSLSRFPTHAPATLSVPTFGKEAAAAAAETVTGWVPPPMRAVRPGSDPIPSRAPGPQPEPAHPVRIGQQPASVPPAPAATLAPAPMPAPTPAAAPTPTEPPAVVADTELDDDLDVEEEVVEPDAFISCRTGEIVLVGIDPDEDGRVTIPANLVTMIKRQIAWSPR